MHDDEEWLNKAGKSGRLYHEARKYLPEGVSDTGWPQPSIYQPRPLFFESGKGSKIYDVDGNSYTDYWLAAGPLILGHSPSEVIHAIKEQIDRGTTFCTMTELSVGVAKKISELVPCAQKVLFCSSGTEATMHALRIARGFTGKKKILKFEGQYHGMHDYVMVSNNPPTLGVAGTEIAPNKVPFSAGIPQDTLNTVEIASWNNIELAEKAIRRNRDDLAAVIAAPIPCSMGVVPPKKGYLKALRELTEENDILLIFDEIITGFRVSLGGAQELLGVTPDLCTMAKALGGGFPMAAIGGKADVMDVVGIGKVVHMGTMNANPLVLAASKATLEILEGGALKALNDTGRKLMKGIQDVIADKHAHALVQGFGSVFQVYFTDLQEIRNYRDFLRVDSGKYAEFAAKLLNEKIWISPSPNMHWFVSSAHTKEDVDSALEATAKAMM